MFESPPPHPPPLSLHPSPPRGTWPLPSSRSSVGPCPGRVGSLPKSLSRFVNIPPLVPRCPLSCLHPLFVGLASPSSTLFSLSLSTKAQACPVFAHFFPPGESCGLCFFLPQVWDRSNTSDTLLGMARIPIAETLGNGDGNGWYKLVGTGDQVRARQNAVALVAV